MKATTVTSMGLAAAIVAIFILLNPFSSTNDGTDGRNVVFFGSWGDGAAVVEMWAGSRHWAHHIDNALVYGETVHGVMPGMKLRMTVMASIGARSTCSIKGEGIPPGPPAVVTGDTSGAVQCTAVVAR